MTFSEVVKKACPNQRILLRIGDELIEGTAAGLDKYITDKVAQKEVGALTAEGNFLKIWMSEVA